MNKKIPTQNQRVLGTSGLAKPDFDNFLRYSRLFYEAHHYSNAGPCVNLLEERLAKFHNSKYCVTFCSGFWALAICLQCTKIEGKRDVLMPSLTYRRLADLASWIGLSPIYYDIDPQSLTATTCSVEQCITDDTAVVLGVHPIVNLFPVLEIRGLCSRLGLPFIMDSVESVYETCKGYKTGSTALAEVFSLHASKLINGGEGGYVTTNSASLYKQLKCLRAFGFDGMDQLPYENGINAKLNEIHAAMALANLDSLDSFIGHNESIYRAYQASLALIPGLRLIEFDETSNPSYKNIVIRVEPCFPVNRDDLVIALNSLSILARPYYYPPLHHKEKRSFRLNSTDYCATNHLVLPSGYQVTEGDVALVCKTIADVIKVS